MNSKKAIGVGLLLFSAYEFGKPMMQEIIPKMHQTASSVGEKLKQLQKRKETEEPSEEEP